MLVNVDPPNGKSAATLLWSLSSLESILLTEADSGERARTLTDRTVAVLKDTGIMNTWVPKSLDGLEPSFSSGLCVMEELARIDASGDADPVASNDMPEGRAPNRRVELTLAGTGQ
jgi:hypothetical protein